MMYSILQQSQAPMSQEMFENFKKHLPPEARKQVERRHKELQKIEAERELREEIKLSKVLDSETLMRFAYVPFVIANLAWDYADTVVSVAGMLNLTPVKKLSRAVRELKREYDIVRAPYIDDAHRHSEEDNMYVFEDGVKDLFTLYLSNIDFDLKKEYPELSDDHRKYVKAAYQCHIVLLALYRYVEMQKAKIEKIVRHTIGDVLPSSLRRLDILIVEFIGDKPVSAGFTKQQSTYAQCIANRIALVELNETKDAEQ